MQLMRIFPRFVTFSPVLLYFINYLFAHGGKTRTSGYLEQILDMASRTSNCDSVKPDISIIRQDDVMEKHLADVIFDKTRGGWCGRLCTTRRKHAKVIAADNAFDSILKTRGDTKCNWAMMMAIRS